MKFFRGAARDARVYVEADHQQADDYYLAEGSGVAELIEMGPDGAVMNRLEMDAEVYEAWVEGVDVHTGEDKGSIRRGAAAIERPPLRFAEVVVNGPKSWSLAAGLHPAIATAYERAQDLAVEEIGRFVAGSATTRVGSRGDQSQMPAASIEMAAVRHYTSRGGDPHRHIHLQFNARVIAVDGAWRGIDSAALLRMQRAINGIGHRAVVSDPQFRQVLADHGYSLDEAGEIIELANIVPAMSKRSEQVAANIARYEAEWRAANPDREPGKELLRAWDRRAWADGREAKKNPPADGTTVEDAWISELRSLGVDVEAEHRRPARGVSALRPGLVDRAAAADRALAVLGAGARGRSTWNVYDIRGVVEEVVTELNVVADRAVLDELTEDISARVDQASLSVLHRGSVPDHIRHLTSEAVIALQRDIDGRLAVRAATDHADAATEQVAAAEARLAATNGEHRRLDAGQVAAVRAIAGTGQLVLIEGAAGAGKTAVLSTAAQILADQDQRLVVVAPTRKAALVASDEIDADTNTAAALAYQYGYRWDRAGVWSRLAIGDVDPRIGYEYRGPRGDARLHRGDVLVVDEAGMLDQETARALLTAADEAGTRVVMVGDRRQLPAVGIGGVVDAAVRWAPTRVELTDVHRFRRLVPQADGSTAAERDEEFADLSLRIRSGIDPGQAFDELVQRGEIRLHDSEADAMGEIAWQVARRHRDGTDQSVSVATNEAASLMNEAVRDQLVAAGLIDDQRVVHGSDGLRIGAGDRVMTRSNDPYRGIANRQLWTVQQIHDDGSVSLDGPAGPRGTEPAHATITPDYVREYLHLAYATTVHGVQGETADVADVLATDSSDAPGLYVGLTRGRYFRTLHMVGDHDTAREQYVQIAGRNGADLGLESAREAAAAEAALYADPVIPRYRRPAGRKSLGDRLAAVVDQLHQSDEHTEDREQQTQEAIDDLTVDTAHQRGPGQRPTGPHH